MARVLVCDGDSLTLGTKWATHSDGTYPSQVKYTFNQNRWTVINNGVDSKRLSAMITDAPTLVDPYYSSSNEFNIVAIWGGTNDLQLDNAVSSAVYARMVTYGQARRAVGWRVLALTIMARESSTSFEAARQAVNESMRSGWASFADALVDVGASTGVLGVPGGQNDARYVHTDKIHCYGTGYEYVARLVRDAMIGLGATVYP